MTPGIKSAARVRVFLAEYGAPNPLLSVGDVLRDIQRVCDVAFPAQLPLTPRLSQMLGFISGYIATQGYAPSYEEIADDMGLRSLASVWEGLGKLQSKGYIRRRHNEARSISLVEVKP